MVIKNVPRKNNLNKIIYQVFLFLFVSFILYNTKQSFVIKNFKSLFINNHLSIYHEMNVFGENMDIYIFDNNNDYDTCNIMIYESNKNFELLYNEKLDQYIYNDKNLYNFTNIYWVCSNKLEQFNNYQQWNIHAMLTVNSTTIDHNYSDFITQIMVDYPWIIDYRGKRLNVMYWSMPNTKRALLWHNLEYIFKNVSLNHIKPASKYNSEVLYGKYICESYLQQNYQFTNSEMCNFSKLSNNNEEIIENKVLQKDYHYHHIDIVNNRVFENYGFWYHLGENQINIIKYMTDENNKTKIYNTQTIHLQLPNYFYDLDNELELILEKNNNIKTNYYFKDLYYAYRKKIVEKFKKLAFLNNDNNIVDKQQQLTLLFEQKLKKICFLSQYENINFDNNALKDNKNYSSDYNIINREVNHCKKQNVYYNLITSSTNWISNLNEPLAKNKSLHYLYNEKSILDYNLQCLLHDQNIKNFYICDQIAQEIAWIHVIQSSNILDWIMHYNNSILECDIHIFEDINYEYDIDKISATMGTYQKSCETKQVIDEWKSYCPRYWVWDYNYNTYPNLFPNQISQSIWYLKNIFNI